MLRSHLLTILFCLFSFTLVAQIPEIEEVEDDVEMDEGIEMPYYDRSRPSYGIRYHGDKRQLVLGDSALSPILDNIQSTRVGFYITLDKGKYGLLDKKGGELLPRTYDSIYSVPYTSDLVTRKKGKYGVVSSDYVEFKKDTTIVHRDSLHIITPRYEQILFANLGQQTILCEKEGDAVTAYNPFTNATGVELSSVRIAWNAIIAKQDGKEGVFYAGRVTIPFAYDTIFFRNKDRRNRVRYPRNANKLIPKRKITYMTTRSPFAMVQKDSKWGLMHVNGEEILPVNLDAVIFDHLRHIYKLRRENKWGVYGYKKLIIPVEYERVYTDGRRFITVTKNGKQGIFDYAGNQVLPPEFDKISIQGWSTAFQVKKDNKYGWYSSTGQVMIPLIYDELDDFGSFQPKYKGMFKATKDGKKGIIDTNGVIVPVEYDELWSIYDGRYFVVTSEGKRGLYSTEGQLVLPIEYDWVGHGKSRKCETLITRKGGLRGFFVNADTIVEAQFQRVEHILDRERLKKRAMAPEALLKVQNAKGKWGVINEQTGQIVVPVIYDDIPQQLRVNRVNYFVVSKKGKYGVLTAKGEITVPFNYQTISFNYSMWSEQGKDSSILLMARLKGKMGAINFNNEKLLPFEYDDLAIVNWTYFDGELLLKAKKKGAYALIDHEGKELTPYQFSEISNFEKGTAMSFKDGQMRMISLKGEYVGSAVPMDPHDGFTSFSEMKEALWQAFEDSTENSLMDFCLKIAPSEHMQYYLTKNLFSSKPMASVSKEGVALKYYYELKYFRDYIMGSEKEAYRRAFLEVEDFVTYEHGMVSVYRTENHAMGSNKLERLFRNPVKVNGYWISTYYMKHYFR